VAKAKLTDLDYTKKNLPIFHPRDSILAIQKRTFKKIAKKKIDL
jgi:hypothetical protein